MSDDNDVIMVIRRDSNDEIVADEDGVVAMDIVKKIPKPIGFVNFVLHQLSKNDIP